MKIKIFIGLSFLFCANVHSQNVLWQIGKQDNSAAEFALVPAIGM